MFTPGGEAVDVPDGRAAGDVGAWLADADAPLVEAVLADPWLADLFECGITRYRPRPARTTTMRAKASFC
jgi:hypothetical protein